MNIIVDGEFHQRRVDGTKAMGGTEITATRLTEMLKQRLGDKLNEFYIAVSRVDINSLPNDKIRLLWVHDLPGDPMYDYLKTKNGQDKFHRYIFVSNWQMQAFINYYQLPWSRCIVIQNAIDVVPEDLIKKPDPKDEIKLIYHSTPHRGLNILTAVFQELCKKYDNLTLDVYSSFNLYGWGQRDEEYKEVFDQLDAHPKVNNHGSVPHDELMKALGQAHIFAFPSTWAETSCRCLIEAMSAKCLAVHSNFGALPETAANWTQMYQFNEDPNQHASMLYAILDASITNIEQTARRVESAKSYIDVFYNWETRIHAWTSLLLSLLSTINDRSIPEEKFTISTSTH